MKKILFAILFFSMVALSYGQELNLANNGTVKVYPNPSKNIVTISIENTELVNAQVSIHSIIGNRMTVDIESIEKGKYKADVENLPAGFYLVVVKDVETKFNKTYKFLKQ